MMTTHSSTPSSISSETSSSSQIFEIKKFNFLKKKRQESIEKTLKQNPWTENEDKLLKETIYTYPSLSWQIIAEKLSGRTPSQCMYRWKMCLEPTIKKGKWTKEEDSILEKYVSENGIGNWVNVRPFLQGRTTKQIRERYINHLIHNSNNSEHVSLFKWNEELDKYLLELYILYGSSWVIISKHIIGTSENMVKNRFYSLLRQCVNRMKKNNSLKNKTITSTIIDEDKLKVYSGLKEEKRSNLEIQLNNPEKQMILTNNPYVTCGKSLKKNYSLKILLEFLPELLEEKGININEVKMKKMAQEKSLLGKTEEDEEYQAETEQKKKAAYKIFKILNSHISTQNEEKTQVIEIASSKTSKSKSSILFNMQLSQLGCIFEKLKNTLMHKYFECLKNKTFS